MDLVRQRPHTLRGMPEVELAERCLATAELQTTPALVASARSRLGAAAEAYCKAGHPRLEADLLVDEREGVRVHCEPVELGPV